MLKYEWAIIFILIVLIEVVTLVELHDQAGVWSFGNPKALSLSIPT